MSVKNPAMAAWDKAFSAAKKAKRAAEDKSCSKAIARARKAKCKCKRKHVKKAKKK